MTPSRCQGIWRTENMDSTFAGMTVLLCRDVFARQGLGWWLAGPGGWHSPRPGTELSGCGLAVVRAAVDALGVAGGAVARGLTGRAAVQAAGLVRVVRVHGLLVASLPVSVLWMTV